MKFKTTVLPPNTIDKKAVKEDKISVKFPRKRSNNDCINDIKVPKFCLRNSIKAFKLKISGDFRTSFINASQDKKIALESTFGPISLSPDDSHV